MGFKKIICLITVLIAGCNNGIDERMLPGRYHFNTNNREVLDLFNNHTYLHNYVNSKGKKFQNRGKWRYNGKDIECHDFNFFNDLGPTGGPGIWNSVVERDNNNIKFIYSDDDNSGFVKD